MGDEDLRILIVAADASMRFGGEASLPLYYFTLFRARGFQAWLLVHERTREELRGYLAAEEFARVSFVPDTWLHRSLWIIGRMLPRKIDDQTLGVIRRLWTQWLQRAVGRLLVREHGVNIVHEASPISPKDLSMMHTLGPPLVVGPLCGGMDYPPAFQSMQSGAARLVEHAGRLVSHVLHRVVRGKLLADALVVANEVTRRALPRGVRGRVYDVVESGVDLAIWKPAQSVARDPSRVTFVFAGRLVDWKGVEFLLEAFKIVADRTSNAFLEIIGGGVLQRSLEQRAADAGIASRVHFAGWLSRPESAERIRMADVFVLPSLRECGGTVILEAFALGLPVIATNWGGPSIYVDDHTGIRVNPSSREAFIGGLAAAMIRLAADEALRQRMGEAALRRAGSNYFDWDSKANRMLQIFRETIDGKSD